MLVCRNRCNWWFGLDVFDVNGENFFVDLLGGNWSGYWNWVNVKMILWLYVCDGFCFVRCCDCIGEGLRWRIVIWLYNWGICDEYFWEEVDYVVD